MPAVDAKIAKRVLSDSDENQGARTLSCSKKVESYHSIG
jgi:hypothetical protein